MHAVLSDPYTVIAAALAVLGSTAWLAYRIGVWRSAKRISQLLKTDRTFGLTILEELAERWSVKIERTETPGGS